MILSLFPSRFFGLDLTIENPTKSELVPDLYNHNNATLWRADGHCNMLLWIAVQNNTRP